MRSRGASLRSAMAVEGPAIAHSCFTATWLPRRSSRTPSRPQGSPLGEDENPGDE
jgi:hypothetical protein